MHPLHERLLRSRRDFLTSAAGGVGLVALASLLREQGLLADEAHQGADAPRSPSVAVPRVGDFLHPLAAVYRLAVLPHVRELLAADRLRPVFLFDAVPTRVIEPHELADTDPDFRSLRNLNTPEEYEAALRELAAGPPG